jgi:hypothetical protein
MSTSTLPDSNHHAKVEISWDQFIDGNLPPSPAWQLYRNTVIDVAAQAKAAMPEANGRVDRARDLVLGGLVVKHEDSSFTVGSASESGKSYTVAEGRCTCPDAEKLVDGRCKHLISTWIWRKARAAVETQQPTSNGHTPVTTNGTTPESSRIPAQFLVELHGKQFITYAGLLALAHEQGLITLTARFISVDAKLALAEASATFTGGKTFTEAADASPDNVHPRIRQHYPRMALTRAKARCLRDALNVSMVAVEELAD